MIVDIGNIALPLAMILSIYAGIGSFVGGSQKIPTLIISARYGIYTVPLLIAISTITLIYAFVAHDFSVRYVAENSNLAMPTEYTWVAFYAGNAGSLLFIALVLSLIHI